MQEVLWAEVYKLLQAGIIYPISDSPWVSPMQVMPKKLGITVVQNDKGEEVSTHLTSGWRVCIDYWKLNVVTKKDHFPLPFIDQVFERVSGHPFYYFLDGYSRYFSNWNSYWRSGEDHFHLSIRNLCIQTNVFRLMQCTSNIPKMHVKHFHWYGGAYYGSLYGWYHRIWKCIWLMFSQFGSCSEPMHWERLGAQLGEMPFYGTLRDRPWAYYLQPRHWGG